MRNQYRVARRPGAAAGLAMRATYPPHACDRSAATWRRRDPKISGISG